MFPPPAQMQPQQEVPQLPQPVHVPAHKKSADGQQQSSVVVQNLNLNSPKNNFQTQSQTVTPLPMLTNPSPFPQHSLGPNYHHALFPQPLFQTANHSFNMAPSPALPLQQQHVLQAPSAQDNFQQIR
jgi:hypothetical protein